MIIDCEKNKISVIQVVYDKFGGDTLLHVVNNTGEFTLNLSKTSIPITFTKVGLKNE